MDERANWQPADREGRSRAPNRQGDATAWMVSFNDGMMIVVTDQADSRGPQQEDQHVAEQRG